MAHGHPDWGVFGPGETVYRSLDMAELAARMGAPNSCDRLGDVVMLDSFEYGLSRWSSELIGVGSAVGISVTPTRTGGYAMTVDTGTGAPATVGARTQTPFNIRGRVGYEFHTTNGDHKQTITMLVNVRGPGGGWSGAIRYDHDNEILEVDPHPGAYVTFATDVFLLDDDLTFHPFKLVIDADTGKYVRAKVGGITYDLSAYALQPLAAEDEPWMRLWIRWRQLDGFTWQAFCDDVIMTQNEP